MTKSNIEYVKQFNPTQCYKCDGTGYGIGPGIRRKQAIKNLCKTCGGTGRWNEDNYHLITTLPNGEKIAFQVDGGK
jgi:DnaJ-class molecular chaperone